tara:strand:- start:85 stop:1032 length:948 start_codon:yes stop_codon:yes gene_type:complete
MAKYVEKYDNGQIKVKGEGNKDNKNGIWKWYYENGQLEKIETYENGIEKGQFKRWYEDGTLAETSFRQWEKFYKGDESWIDPNDPFSLGYIVFRFYKSYNKQGLIESECDAFVNEEYKYIGQFQKYNQKYWKYYDETIIEKQEYDNQHETILVETHYLETTGLKREKTYYNYDDYDNRGYTKIINWFYDNKNQIVLKTKYMDNQELMKKEKQFNDTNSESLELVKYHKNGKKKHEISFLIPKGFWPGILAQNAMGRLQVQMGESDYSETDFISFIDDNIICGSAFEESRYGIEKEYNKKEEIIYLRDWDFERSIK